MTDEETSIDSFKVECKIGMIDVYGVYIPLVNKCVHYSSSQVSMSSLGVLAKVQIDEALKTIVEGKS